MGRFADLASALNGPDPVKAMEAVRDQTGPKTNITAEGERLSQAGPDVLDTRWLAVMWWPTVEAS